MKRTNGLTVAIAAAAATVVGVFSPVQASEADDKIVSSFEQSYIYRTYLKEDSVKTVAKDGVVTLSGTVSDEFRKSLAQDTVSNLAGVTRVENELTTTAEVAAENSDKWISRKVVFALLLHRNVSAKDTTVAVENGVVTLTGVADSLAQKELTGEYAADIDKVTSVKNNITVAMQPAAAVRSPGEKLDDASITAQVKTALFTHRSTNSVKTKVETRDGVVTLTGIAKNAAEKSLVTKLVSDIHGVSTVKNEMTIEAAATK